MADESIYKVTFLQQKKVHELYARSITEDELLGFIQVEELVFIEKDPCLEIFKNVEATLLPMQVVLRIDVVKWPGPVRKVGGTNNVRHLPSTPPAKGKKS